MSRNAYDTLRAIERLARDVEVLSLYAQSDGDEAAFRSLVQQHLYTIATILRDLLGDVP